MKIIADIVKVVFGNTVYLGVFIGIIVLLFLFLVVKIKKIIGNKHMQIISEVSLKEIIKTDELYTMVCPYKGVVTVKEKDLYVEVEEEE